MGIVDGSTDGHKKIDNSGAREKLPPMRWAIKIASQCLPFDIFQNDIGKRVARLWIGDNLEVVNIHDIRVSKASTYTPFLFEAHQKLRIRLQPRKGNFDSHKAPQLRVKSFPDFSHATFAQAFKQFI